MDLCKTVFNYISSEKLIAPGTTLLVAVSGGIDSMVLADILYRLRQDLDVALVIASFDHGLRPESGSDLEFVHSWAEEHGLPFIGGKKDIAAISGGKNVEDIGRRERYAFLRSAAAKCGAAAIATAHHQGDQAETVLLHLLRGSGVTGLAGIHPSGNGLVRPLLCATRSDIASYASANNIDYREDSTNSSTHYLRNRIRLELLPYLSQYNPNIDLELNNLASICRSEDALLDEMAEISLAELWSVQDESLDGPGFFLLSPALQRRVLRKAYQLLAGDLPELSFAQVESIRGLKDEQSCDLPRGIKAWRRRDICFGRNMPPLPIVEENWTLIIDDNWHEFSGLDWSYRAEYVSREIAAKTRAEDMYTTVLPESSADGVYWRTRRDGDYMRSSSYKGRCKVKDLFIEHHIPGHIRVKWPLLVSAAGETLWLPGLRKTAIESEMNNILIKVRISDKINFDEKK